MLLRFNGLVNKESELNHQEGHEDVEIDMVTPGTWPIPVPGTWYLVPGNRSVSVRSYMHAGMKFLNCFKPQNFYFCAARVLGVGMLPDPPAAANDLPTGSYLRPRKMKFVERFSTSSSSNAMNYYRCFI